MGGLQSVYVGPVVSWGVWSATVGGCGTPCHKLPKWGLYTLASNPWGEGSVPLGFRARSWRNQSSGVPPSCREELGWPG